LAKIRIGNVVRKEEKRRGMEGKGREGKESARRLSFG
jgi:hypothetical protein